MIRTAAATVFSLTLAPSFAAEPLTLPQAMGMAAKMSPEVAKAEAEAGMAALDEPSVLALLDPEITLSGERMVDESPQAMPQFFGTKTTRDLFRLGLHQQTLIGGSLGLEFESSREDSDAAFRPLNPASDAFMGLSLSQSLLRGFWGRPDRRRRTQARAGAASAKARLEALRNQAALKGAEAFLQFVQADQEIALRDEAVVEAGRLLSRIRERRRFGTSEESEIYQAEANAEQRKAEARAAKASRVQALAGLRAVLGLAGDEADYQPQFSGNEFGPPASTEPKERPQHAAARLRVESLEARLALTKLQGLPGLTLFASGGWGGLDQRSAEAWKDAASFDHPRYAAGLALSVSMRGRREKMAREAARLDLEAAKADLRGLEIREALEIETAKEFLALSGDQVLAAQALANWQKKTLDAETKAFERGRSSVEILIRFAEAERAARREALRAGANLILARLGLALALGLSPEMGKP